MTESDMSYRIGLVGPTRVGKTSLMTALVSQGQDLLAGTPAKLEAHDDAQERLDNLRDELLSCLEVGRLEPYFRPARSAGGGGESARVPQGVRGTEESYDYRLDLGVGKDVLPLVIKDYPGRWMVPTQRASQQSMDWDACKAFLTAASALIVPVDATAMMEVTTRRERVGARKFLRIEGVRRVVRDWARARAVAQERALLVLAPVKCESYFSDNGGATKDRSGEVFERTRQLYGPVVEDARTEMGDKSLLTVEYHPVDTLGCVERVKSRWVEVGGEGEEAEELWLDCTFAPRVRDEVPELRPFGADGLLIALARHLARSERSRERGFLEGVWRRLTGQKAALARTIKGLADREPPPRYRSFF